MAPNLAPSAVGPTRAGRTAGLPCDRPGAYGSKHLRQLSGHQENRPHRLTREGPSVATEAGGELPGGQLRGLFDGLVDDITGHCSGEVDGVVGDGLGAASINVTGSERFPYPGEPFTQLQREAEFGVGGSPGEP